MIPIQLNYDGLLGKCTIKTELYSIPFKGDCIEFMFNNEFLCIASVYQITHLISKDCNSVILFATDIKQHTEKSKLDAIIERKRMSQLNINARAYNCLEEYFRWKIENGGRRLEDIPISDWHKISVSKLKTVRNLGKKSLDEIIKAFAEYGIILNS